MDQIKADQLRMLLASLPAPIAARLAKAVEADRMLGGTALPHDVILDAVRPTLRKSMSKERTPTPLRMFCRPFEDLLTLQPRKQKMKGRIARGSITPLWNWISQSLAPGEAQAFSDNIKAVALRGPEKALETAEAFWAVAAQAIHAAMDSERGVKAARAVFDGEAALADVREAALLLSIGPEIFQVQELLPRGTPVLTDELVWKLREIYDRVVASVPDAAPYIAVVTMHRIEKPWEALKLPLHISRQTQDTLVSSTDMGMVGEILFSDIEFHGDYLRAAQPRQFDAEMLIFHLAAFTTLSSGIVKGVEMRRDGKWGQRLMKDRAAVGGIMDDFMARAPKDVAAALPTVKSGSYAGGPRVPDLSHACDADKAEQARNVARLVAGCRPIAAAASFAASQKTAFDEISTLLKSYIEDLLKALRNGDEAKRAIAEQFFMLAVDLTSLLFSEEEAEFVRRRGRAALPVAAA